MNHDVRRAILISWWIVAAAGALAVLAPLVLPAAWLFGWTPSCPGCFLCGMTTAFVFIARGDFAGALSANHGSLFLYAGLALNALAASRSIQCKWSR